MLFSRSRDTFLLTKGHSSERPFGRSAEIWICTRQATQIYFSVGGILKIWLLLEGLYFLSWRLMQCMNTTDQIRLLASIIEGRLNWGRA